MEMFSIFSFRKCSTLVKSGRAKKKFPKNPKKPVKNFSPCLKLLQHPWNHMFLSIIFFTLSKTLLTLSFPFFSFIYLEFGVLLPNSKSIHYTLYHQICACMLRKLIDQGHILSYSIRALIEYQLKYCQLRVSKLRVARL